MATAVPLVQCMTRKEQPPAAPPPVVIGLSRLRQWRPATPELGYVVTAPSLNSTGERITVTLLIVFSWVTIQSAILKVSADLLKKPIENPRHGTAIILLAAGEVVFVFSFWHICKRFRQIYEEPGGAVMAAERRPCPRLSAVLCVDAETADAEDLETASHVQVWAIQPQ